jgi:hypothetical protein
MLYCIGPRGSCVSQLQTAQSPGGQSGSPPRRKQKNLSDISRPTRTSITKPMVNKGCQRRSREIMDKTSAGADEMFLVNPVGSG